MHQPARRDEVLDPLFEVRDADRFRPASQRLKERDVLRRRRPTQLLERLQEDLLLHLNGRVRLLDGDREPFEKRFIEQVRPRKASIIRATTLGVRRSKHGESRLRRDHDAELLDRERLAFQHRLQAHHLGRGQVDLVDRDGAAAQHRHRDGAEFEHGFPVLQTEPADEVVFIGFERDVNTNVLHLFEGARLLDLKRLSVSRQPRNKHGMELLGLDDLADHIELPKGHERRVLLGNASQGRRLRHQRLDPCEGFRRTGGGLHGERQRRRLVDHAVGGGDRSGKKHRRRGRLLQTHHRSRRGSRRGNNTVRR